MSEQTENEFMLSSVRVSYPHLFQRPVIRGEEGKYGATLLLTKGEQDRLKEMVQARIEELITEKKLGRIGSDKRCLRDGDEGSKDEYVGYWTISANTDQAPFVWSSKRVDKKLARIEDPEKNEIYAGCYVNAKIRLWAQNNQYGKRVNATLIAIQFAKAGEPLTSNFVTEETASSGFDASADDDGEGWG